MREFVGVRVFRVVLLVLVLAAATAPITGCRKAAPEHSGEQEAGARGLALWEVTKGGKSDYLFGTCHMGVALAESLPHATYSDEIRGSVGRQ